jgi:hypothetical protein
LAAACRNVSLRAAVTRRKGNVFRKIRTQWNCRPRKELAATGRKMACCGKVAQRKRHELHGQGKENVSPKTSKGLTLGRGQRTKQQGNKWIRKQDLKKLQLESTGKVIKTSSKTARQEIAKRIARSTVGL